MSIDIETNIKPYICQMGYYSTILTLLMIDESWFNNM